MRMGARDAPRRDPRPPTLRQAGCKTRTLPSASADEHADDERDASGNAHGLPRILAHVVVRLFGGVLRLLHDLLLRVDQALTRHTHRLGRALARLLNLFACLAGSRG